MTKKTRLAFLILLVVVVFILSAFLITQWNVTPGNFNASRAYKDVEYQMSLGPRTPGSQSHQVVHTWIQDQLKKSNWKVDLQDTQMMGHPVQNIIAKRGEGYPWIIIGAHYDSRLIADQDKDPDAREKPVPGANDGASGVAVLLELARILPKPQTGQIWLVFFDSEDQGDIAGWDWILGSRAFVESLPSKPDAAVIIDMIGDKDLNLYWERNSNLPLTNKLWKIAQGLGYGKQFIASYKYSMEDDHTPFLEKGIPAVDIIDFDYPYWHTSADTADKVSPESLKAIGDTLLKWLLGES
jgi:glutaminyl-peptide cyclotransferase